MYTKNIKEKIEGIKRTTIVSNEMLNDPNSDDDSKERGRLNLENLKDEINTLKEELEHEISKLQKVANDSNNSEFEKANAASVIQSIQEDLKLLG